MIYLLEYNRNTHQYHYNHLRNDNITFQSELFTHGWNPICILPEGIDSDDEFIKFTYQHAAKKMGYKRVYALVNMWVMNWMERRHIIINETSE